MQHWVPWHVTPPKLSLWGTPMAATPATANTRNKMAERRTKSLVFMIPKQSVNIKNHASWVAYPSRCKKHMH